ncbi:DoxX family protein [Mucilaginibacter litoreus]|uniref:DoxX family protein n=1 Tax=Mucilaginibacter litoreus TaxID=1048221 RepID=A0ABW3ATH3_9SPHI
MNVIHKIEQWGDRHHPALLDVLRIALGLFLFLKGFAFMQNMTFLKYTIEEQNIVNLSEPVLQFVMYYVAAVHMAGGLCIILGLFTRLFCILQLPVVVSALFLINIFRSGFNNDLWMSVFACTLLTLFLLIGSGPFSIDHLVETMNQDKSDANKI